MAGRIYSRPVLTSGSRGILRDTALVADLQRRVGLQDHAARMRIAIMEQHRRPDRVTGDREIGMIGPVAPEQIEVAGLQIFDVRQVARRQLARDAVAVPTALDDRFLNDVEELANRR